MWGAPADPDTLTINDDLRDNTWEVTAGSFGDFLQIDGHETIDYETFSTVKFVNNRGNDLISIHPTLLKGVGPTIVTPLVNPAQTHVELIGTDNADNATATATTIGVNGKNITFGDANTSGGISSFSPSFTKHFVRSSSALSASRSLLKRLLNFAERSRSAS